MSHRKKAGGLDCHWDETRIVAVSMAAPDKHHHMAMQCYSLQQHYTFISPTAPTAGQITHPKSSPLAGAALLHMCEGAERAAFLYHSHMIFALGEAGQAPAECPNTDSGLK